jgi:hypothetical protein
MPETTGRSFERINYGLRPAKNIERKMLCEALHRLSAFGHLETYRYIGFGSTYFSDFILFHKSLGITAMVSIEHAVEHQARFESNLPYKCITLEFGESTAVLPRLPWDKRSIVWLDYDGVLDAGVLADVATVCANAISGSVLLLTVNANIPKDRERKCLPPREVLRRNVGEEKLPDDLQTGDFLEWGTAQIYRGIIDSQIRMTLKQRNGGLAGDCRIDYAQVFNFNYSDGTRMLTLGGLLYEEGHRAQVENCGFANLKFYRPGDESYVIEVPLLTFLEIRRLNQLLPVDDCDQFVAPPVPPSDARKYARIYKYFPTFTEAEV